MICPVTFVKCVIIFLSASLRFPCLPLSTWHIKNSLESSGKKHQKLMKFQTTQLVLYLNCLNKQRNAKQRLGLPWFSFVLVLSMWICKKSLLCKAVVSSPSLKIVFVVQCFLYILPQTD